MTTQTLIENIEIHYHRNGISGEGFYACTFDDPENGRMLAVVFPPDPITDPDDPNHGEPDWELRGSGGWDNPRVAVFEADKLPDVRFGWNSWRGDNYAPALYKAIAAWGR